jgi:hypothetical protein
MMLFLRPSAIAIVGPSESSQRHHYAKRGQQTASHHNAHPFLGRKFD